VATRCEYLTARCTRGCEVWLHPKAVEPHAGRCKGLPWTDRRRPVTQVFLDNEEAHEALQICPPELLDHPNFSEDRILKPRPGMYVHDHMNRGLVLRAPLPHVSGRRWWTVVRAAAHEGRAIDSGFAPDTFGRLEEELGLVDYLVGCATCGDDVKPRGLKAHRRSNSVCRFLADTAEVRTFWSLGYRDPYVLQADAVPTAWTELNSRVQWRNRLHIVRFRLWTAVLFRPG
jgi:hypothetical protein